MHLDAAAVGDRHRTAVATIATGSSEQHAGVVEQAVASSGDGDAATATTNRLTEQAVRLHAGGDDGAAVVEVDAPTVAATAATAADL